MEHTHLLRDLIILYGLAMVIAYFARRLRQPTVVGYLVTGLIAGPSGLMLISEMEVVEILADVGVALLLFTIGVELSLEKLARMKRVVLGSGSLQVGGTVLLAWGAMLWWGVTPRESVFWGFLIATSSTAIVLKLLYERGEFQTAHGRVIIGILLFQDLCVVPMMALVPALAAPGAGQALTILWALVKSLGLVGIILLLAYYLFPPLLRQIVLTRSRELFVIAAIFLALGTAFSASALGLSLAMGAFLAGIVLSESEYGHQLVAEILPFRDLFTSLFFISVGMLINLKFVAGHLPLLLGVALAIIAVKLLTGGAAIAALGFPVRMAALVSLALAHVGEFAFVLLREGAKVSMISEERYQLFLAAAVLTMALTPAMIAAAPRISRMLGDRSHHRNWLALDEKTEQMRDHVIVCGFGLNGRRLARVLRENHLPYVVIEMDPRLVRSARAEGEPIYFGDVSSREILHQAGAAHARAIVFGISDPAVLPRAITIAREENPEMHIIARIKRVEDAPELRRAGATDVISEEVEAWMEIMVRVLRLFGMPREVVAAQLGQLREEDYEMLRELPIPGQPLRQLKHLLPHVDMEIFIVPPGAPPAGRQLRELDLRARTGAAVIAVLRGTQVLHNPSAELVFEGTDQIVLLGAREQLDAAFRLLREEVPAP
jgi:CPA2 family monovalent cation:H+ antiporter-2